MRNRVKRQCCYDARANDVNLRDITSSEKNANHLRALRDEQPGYCCKKLSLMTRGYDDSREYDFIIREGDDLGWLGYFLGRSSRIEAISILSLPENRERIDALIEGIARNQSINKFRFATDDGYQSFERFKSVDSILSCNEILYKLDFSAINIGCKRARNIASTLRLMQHKSMKDFFFYQNNITSDEAFSVVCEALRSHPQLEKLYLEQNNIGRDGCRALGNMLSSWHAPNLQYLNLGNNSIDDGGLQALVDGMMNCSNLERLILSGNRSITAAGLRSLSTLFQSENFVLKELWLERMNIGDDGATALVDGLVGNTSLMHLIFDVDTAGITEVGWSAFSKLLCDTSSNNNTYLSNHTLEWIGHSDDRGAPEDVKTSLDLNKVSVILRNKQDVAILKILRHQLEHQHQFDTESLFRWTSKFLPLVVSWFERARSVFSVFADADAFDEEDLDNLLEALEAMKLSAVYKFVRGMPLLIIDGYNSRRTSTHLSRKRRLDGETK